MPHSRNAELALLKWANTFPIDPKLESLAQLSDGFVFNKMLEDIDPSYAVDLNTKSGPSGASQWLDKKQRLEVVYKSLLRYVHNHSNDLESLTLENIINFNSIAEHGDSQETFKLLTIFLMAAVRGATNAKFVALIQELDSTTQREIAAIIQQMFSVVAKSSPASTSDDAPAISVAVKDSDLAFEEEHALLHAKHADQKKRQADLMTRFERLQLSYDELLEHSNEADRLLQTLQSSSDGGDQADYLRSLKGQLQEANDLIANQEQQAELDRVTKERQQKELASLRPSAKHLLELEDEVKELRSENAILTRKANKVDHFQMKLESQSGIVKENTSLQQRIDTLEDNQKDYDKVHEQNSKLRKTVEEYESRFPSYELQLVEEVSKRRLLEEHLRDREAQLERLKDNKRHDEVFIQELQEQVRSNIHPPSSPGSVSGEPEGLTLGEELERSDDSAPTQNLEMSRLKAENQLLKSNPSATSNSTLRAELDESERIRARLKENLQALTEEHAISQEQLQALISTTTDEKNQAIISTRRLYLEANQDLITTRSKLSDTQSELSSRHRELLAAKADLGTFNKEDMVALESLKTTHRIINSSLNDNLLLLESKYKALTIDYELQKSHLVEALLSKDKLREDNIQSKDIGQSIDEKAAAISGAIEDNVLQGLKERTEKQELLIQDLQARLQPVDGDVSGSKKVGHDALVNNLARENSMLVTAWYDLTMRLQSNHVVLQRKQDVPKSWLKRQRQAISATPRR